ncbi:hypothetical protein [Kamptonema sp. UHCC 0994]|uniref:hypothetical protein n=1 Tax=Kamptonema sp. UHCC 0994 TaxID=3031329 RepID=UPI0023B92810|nr:hypothetical protein [Kamptonema sp. UHCC 0994]MDF0554793.1 hypothetical protein [Kamptonema sp. UHCC 0994]
MLPPDLDEIVFCGGTCGYLAGRFHSRVRSLKVKAIALSDKIFSDRYSINTSDSF